MATNRLRLHVAKDVEELNQMASELPKVLNARAYLKTAENVYKKGEDLLTQGNEESAYIMFMRYINIITAIQKTSEFRKNEASLSQMVDSSHQRTAVDMIRQLRQSLKKRYELKHGEEMDRHKKELALEKEKLKVREAKLANQRSADVEDAKPTVGFQMTVNPSTGQAEYDVVSRE